MSEPILARVVTFTANPSIDRTVVLPAPLVPGEVTRAVSVTEQAAGKGVNVARVLRLAGCPVTVVAAGLDDAFQRLAGEARPPLEVQGQRLAAGQRVRINTTLTDPAGVTTKINEAGPKLTAEQLEVASELLLASARGAAWVALSGSLPPGAPDDWYARLITRLSRLGARVAVDTSGAALDAVLAGLPGGRFDLIKPNSDELAQLVGGDAAAFEEAAAAGEVGDIVAAARDLHRRGIANVLVTLGGAGAVLVTADGAWFGRAPRTQVRSTVGAGDSAVAGFVLAQVAGRSPAECLASSIAYGSAAASLPGTTLPAPRDLPVEPVEVVEIRC
ncbi:MAG TPA: 1-phosphofructokinase family hexose kinase [Arachnia sp.]|nr:1-phosphofructokinase family hexose kinase [Arachnia sp.]